MCITFIIQVLLFKFVTDHIFDGKKYIESQDSVLKLHNSPRTAFCQNDFISQYLLVLKSESIQYNWYFCCFKHKNSA